MNGSWTTYLRLVALEGDVEPGMVIPLDPDRVLNIGRASKGLQLPDPLVSIKHAKISLDERRGYVVTDLDSATGTWVDEELIQNASRPIGIGTRLRFGDTYFEVQVRRRYPPWLAGVMIGAVLLCVAAGVLWLLAGMRAPRPPLLVWSGPVRQSSTFSSDLVVVPPLFARERGIDVRDLRIIKVTDRDYDGLDELWLRDGTERQHIVTFQSDGTWVDLGTTPVDCHDLGPGLAGSSEGFAAMDCAGVTYMLVDGKYAPASHEGVVVWSQTNPPAPEADPEAEPIAAPPRAPARPLRVVLKESGRLAGFLAERGISDQIHYLICDGAFPGVKAQVLTSTGRLKTLAFGCVGALKMSEEGTPVAIALTAAGREALLADLTTFYGGSPEGLFVSPEMEVVLDEARRSPGYQRSAVKLTADSQPVFVDPVAQERVIPGTRALVPRDARSPGSSAATVATISSEGVADLDPPGCTALRVRTETFTCQGFCSGGSTFLTVEEVGCGEPRMLIEATYGGGAFDAEVEDLQVRVVIDSSTVAGRPQVRRARLAWRQRPR
jgi:hypothetical protein